MRPPNRSNKFPSLKGQAPDFDVLIAEATVPHIFPSRHSALRSPHGFTHIHTEYISRAFKQAPDFVEDFGGAIASKTPNANPWREHRNIQTRLKRTMLSAIILIIVPTCHFPTSRLTRTSVCVCVVATWGLISSPPIHTLEHNVKRKDDYKVLYRPELHSVRIDHARHGLRLLEFRADALRRGFLCDERQTEKENRSFFPPSMFQSSNRLLATYLSGLYRPNFCLMASF